MSDRLAEARRELRARADATLAAPSLFAYSVLVEDCLAILDSLAPAGLDARERLETALRVAAHKPHDQLGEPLEGFPVCSVCGAIQTSLVPAGLDADRLGQAFQRYARYGADAHGCYAVAQYDMPKVAAEYARLTAAGRTVTHGRHCPCSACAREDWANPGLAHCGMHGPSCPPVYAPVAARLTAESGEPG